MHYDKILSMGSKLSEEVSNIIWNKGTEPAFSGKYNYHDDEGYYLCVNCQLQLFHSSDKFDSGSGWPSFFQPSVGSNIETQEDRSAGMIRTEVHCNNCKAHLGHVFPDGPQPTGLRYCINSVSMNFTPSEED